MLKIKDSVDLKQLEKFGFIYTNEFEQYYRLDENNDILIHERKITLRITKVNVYEDFNLSVLYELTKADIIEKLEVK